MINQHLLEPFAHAYRAELTADSHAVTDEIVLTPRSLTYRVGARLVSIGSHLMGDVSNQKPIAA